MSTLPPAPPRVGPSLAVFLVFLLIGPAIGAVAFGILAGAAMAFTDPGLAASYLLFAIAFMPLAYVTGGIQAGFVGAVAAFAVWRYGAVGLAVPLVAATLAAAYTIARSHEDWTVSTIMLAVHLVAAAACWAIARRMVGWR